MELQDRIKILRDEKGMTQKELSVHLNVDRATISGYETKGKHPDLEKLVKIAKIFDVSLDYLINGNESNNTLDFTVNTEKENLVDANIYQIYSQLNFHSKKDLEHYIQFLHYRQVRVNPENSQ